MWIYVLSAIGILLAALIAIILIRTLLFVPRKQVEQILSPVIVNGEKATGDLAEMIKCRTVSDRDKSLEDESQFERFEALLPELFPLIHKKCKFEKVGDRALLYKWEGKHSDAPTVFMSHYDVVSVEEENWEKPAFEGIVENGVLWGRGTLDTKGTLNGIMQAAEALIAEGFVPLNDIYFAFGGDEEINGHGASDIVALFKERGIKPGMVIDEGGAVADNVFPGVKQPIALIGIAEKGMLNIEYTVKGGGGHASSPAPHTPVGRLSAACVRVENSPFKFRVTRPAKMLFNIAGRHSTFLYRMIFANLWCFSPALNLFAKLSGGEINALVRTTTAFTQMEGSKGMNVIPPVARMVSNHRILPGDTVDSVVARIKKKVNDEKIEVNVIGGNNPSVISDTACEAYERVRSTVAETWTGVIVSSYLMVACSDSRHWGEISDKVYRFSAMSMSGEERASIHGNNEKIPVATISKTVEFFIRLMKKS